jgi:2-oxoisovalerate dehydrogenase E2 component (dihydrolipoyl transacylase)
MPTEIKMPQLGESVHEGTIGRWLKRPGEPVAKYEALVEVITDKVNVEMPSPVSGVLQQILAQEGDTVAVGTSIALLEEPGVPAAASQPPAAAEAPSDRRMQASGSLDARPAPTMPAVSASAPGDPVSAASAIGAAAHSDGRPTPTVGPAARRDSRPRLTPVVRRLVEEHQLGEHELESIAGSGEGGRITKEDVLHYLESRPAAPGRMPARESMATARPASSPPAASIAAVAQPPAAGDQLQRLSPMRRAIADRMAQSAREIPHAYGIIDVDLTSLVRHREAHKAGWRTREGVNVSLTAFIVHAATRALRAFPMVNATFTPEGILLKQAVHFGVGVAVPDGLIVPVIKHADQKSVIGLAREIGVLAARAREGKLTLDDVSGGTFTLTNAGVFGSIYSLPIINYPQAAILTADAVVRRPAVIGEGIAIRDVMHMGLAFDHRIFDGAVGIQFLTHIKRQLEDFKPVGDSPEF